MDFVHATNGDLPYWIGGPPSTDAPTLIFLHGWGVSPWVYQTILNDLSSDFRVIAPCLPGLCWFRHETPIISHSDLAKLVSQFCTSKHITNAHLAGQSTGGGVAACLAVLRPDVAQSLILINSTGGTPQPLAALLFGVVFDVILRRLDLRTPWSQIRIISSCVRNLAGSRERLLRMAWIASHEDLTVEFSSLNLPTLVLWGQSDLLFPERLGRQMHAKIRGSVIRVVESGEHLWSLCRQHEASGYIRRFIKEGRS
jgi:2-hydroxy-6-oxonona-2,4-dienedioate hydrolase